MSGETQTIHVAMLGEGTAVWRPAGARQVGAFAFEVLGPMPDDEQWQFKPGQLVECREEMFSGGKAALVAYRALPPNNSFKATSLRDAP